MDIPPSLDQVKGSQLWKSTDGLTWTQVTNNGFGDTNTIIFEAFPEFEGQVYVSGSKGSSATPTGLGGAKIYRQGLQQLRMTRMEMVLRMVLITARP